MKEQIIGVARGSSRAGRLLSVYPQPPAGHSADTSWQSLSCLDYLFLMLGVDRDNKRSEQSKDASRGEF